MGLEELARVSHERLGFRARIPARRPESLRKSLRDSLSLCVWRLPSTVSHILLPEECTMSVYKGCMPIVNGKGVTFARPSAWASWPGPRSVSKALASTSGGPEGPWNRGSALWGSLSSPRREARVAQEFFELGAPIGTPATHRGRSVPRATGWRR